MQRALLCLVGLLAAVGWAADPQPKPEGQQLGDEFIYRQFPLADGHLSCAHRAGPGPTLVLIPGTFGDARVFAELVKTLDKSLNLVLIENRGLGKSWPPPKEGSIEQCGRDAVLILDALKIDTFYVGGHSLGGMISLELGRSFPRRIRGIISMEGWTNWQAARDAFGNDMKSTLTPEQLRLKEEYRRDVLQRWTPEQIKAFATIWRQWDGTEFLKTTDLPILELYGDRGQKPPADPRLLGIPNRKNIKVFWFEGASHSLLMERPEGVARQTNEFIAQVEKARGG